MLPFGAVERRFCVTALFRHERVINALSPRDHRHIGRLAQALPARVSDPTLPLRTFLSEAKAKSGLRMTLSEIRKQKAISRKQ
jgi:hypothetical protein